MTAEPVQLPPNQPRSFYRDSGAIARFRRTAPDGDGYRPEDWVASTTPRFAQAPAGLTTLPDGTRLAAAVAADPGAWLGPEHTGAYGADTALLVKLLDAGQRLPLHSHPDRAFARAHLGSAHGKTEAWFVVDAAPGAEIRMGFTRDVTADELAGWVERGDTEALHGAVHRVPVAAGDALLCPAGMPHAIGAGVLLVELQEPTDFSVLLEWEGYAIDGATEGHLGLGFGRALAAVDRTGVDAAALARLRGPGAGVASGASVLPPEAGSSFRAELCRGEPTAALDPGFSVLVVLDGAGTLGHERGRPLAVSAGQTVLIPYAAGRTELSGPVSALRCRPPAPGTAG
ncbi:MULTISPECIES: class I mannose-6-phosphate isomerase [Streptomyces violaceusniger group]|uniref:Carbohydrate kinase n=1 Tax=Streptomyces rhizosphaericus TaxID=114699 RepID=A0A6G4A9L9_9ACTN|nr:class I mannose-6-phosphate isomerase [Streptomyces rhizosphaericus]NEW69534.1 carbohydrate kinase [Streptomyces rhizosphaericus]